tara:strand:+ start:269 stop:1285 length:1017 start_codon:yes stop_codon:yes gene_type:complete
MGTYLTKGETFATGNTVTAAKLNNLVDNATVTAGSIGSTELATNAVTADKISTASPQPVTTSTIRANAVSNAKLATMGSQTVKVRATNSTGDASDLAMIGGSSNGSSKVLVGTSDSINAVVADEFKLVNSSDADVTNNTAAKLRLHTTAITGQTDLTSGSPVSDPANDRLLLYDQSATSLVKISPRHLIGSQTATSSLSGSVTISTTAEATRTGTTSASAVLGAAVGSPMLAKAWAKFSHDGSNFSWGTNRTFNIDQSSCTHSNSGGSNHIFTIAFDEDMPSTNYIIVGSAFGGTGIPLFPYLVTPAVGSFTIKFLSTTASSLLPDTEANIVVYSLGS